MSQFPLLGQTATSDVYGEKLLTGYFNLYVRSDNHGSLIIDDDEVVDGGSFNVIIENRGGVPYLMVWTKPYFGNDPKFTINLNDLTSRQW